MKFIVLTLFKEMYDSFLSTSIIKRAIAKGLIEVKLVDIREYTKDKHHRIDSPPIGGGAGLIMKCQPIYDALMANSTKDTYKIALTPKGMVYDQNVALDLSTQKEILILCGHYEGVDERIYNYFDTRISLGDYIVTGGELPSMILIDSISRLIKGVISDESIVDESFSNVLLEHPQYTEPYDFNGYKVPDILYSGNHEAIKKYNHYCSLMDTKTYRPDLFYKYKLTKQDEKLLKEHKENEVPKYISTAIEKGKKFKK